MHRLLNAPTLARTPALAAEFAHAKPFRHVVIDDFLDPAYCERLLAAFPAFEARYAMNENGEVGNKAVIEQIAQIAPEYAQLDALIQSEAFLGWVSQVTGIPDLLYDRHYFGGGTHENRNGQDLDPHIDFNRHPLERWHRRLNLIIYLNHHWEDDWGGSLELHSNPLAEDNAIRLVTPLFNRCVIFETNEISWHGFSRINLPAGQDGLTRKSVALYFYTRERPSEEQADTHSTIYVDRALPDTFRPGHTLTDDDMQALRIHIARRDQHIQRLYRNTTELQKQLEHAQAALQAGKVGALRYWAQRWVARWR